VPTLDTAHRCPGCGAGHAERRTPRSFLERAATALTGHRPYRCLDCGRRFYDRPLERTGESGPRRRSGPPPEPPAPPAADADADPPATIEITTADAEEPRRRRRPRWVIDPGNTPLARLEVYVLVALGVLLLVTIAIALRWLWPEPTGGVRVFD
jgi:hypothetical protein